MSAAATVQAVQYKLATRSVTDRKFGDVHNFVYDRAFLTHAAVETLARRSAHTAGVDGETKKIFCRDMVGNIEELARELKSGDFQWGPTRLVDVKKPTGGTRSLQVPTLRDRIVQRAMTYVLAPIFDVWFATESNGFRPGLGPPSAIDQAERIVGDPRVGAVIALDIKGFFPGLRHEDVLAGITTRVTDKHLLRLVRSALRVSPVGEPKAARGVPQGGPLSPLLSNIAFAPADEFIRTLPSVVSFVRYCDDLLIGVAGDVGVAANTLNEIKVHLNYTFDLEVAEAKTFIRRPDEVCFCLGHDMHRSPTGEVIIRPSLSRVERLRQKLVAIRDGVGRYARLTDWQKQKSTKRLVVGWVNYFRPRALAEELATSTLTDVMSTNAT